MQAPSGAQVLPLPAPDASTARGPERGNAALKATENPSQSGSTEEGRLSGSGNDRGEAPRAVRRKPGAHRAPD